MDKSDANALAVLRSIDDLQFSGRYDPKAVEVVKQGLTCHPHYFDPVPVVAVYGELFPFSFDLIRELRLLETEGSVSHVLSSIIQSGSFIRPDGKTVSVYMDCEDHEYGMHTVSVSGRVVYWRNPYIPHRPEHQFHSPTERRPIRLDTYRITQVGLASLRMDKKSPKVPAEIRVANYIEDQIRNHGDQIKDLTRDGIAMALGISAGTVSGTKAWKELASSRRCDKKGTLEAAAERGDWDAVQGMQNAEKSRQGRVQH